MRLTSIADIQLTGKALVKGWLDDFDERKRKAVHDLFDVVENAEQDSLKIKAFTALVRAGDADRKRDELAIKKQALDEVRRLRLLELLKHIPPGTLAAIASRHAEVTGSDGADGREDKGPGTEG